MKERQSVKFANHTKTRAEWYMKECGEILYRTKSQIILEGELVYAENNYHKIFLLKIGNPKSKSFKFYLNLETTNEYFIYL